MSAQSSSTPNPETREGQEQMKRMGIIPYPLADDLTRPFWDAANRHELVIQRCTNCAEYRHPPSEECPICDSTAVEWSEISGRGRVFTFIIDHRNEVPGFDGNYVFALVIPDETDGEAARLTGNVLECDPHDVYIGMPVEVCYREVRPGITLPQFRPAREATLRSKGQAPD